jgi:hypothetical protein
MDSINSCLIVQIFIIMSSVCNTAQDYLIRWKKAPLTVLDNLWHLHSRDQPECGIAQVIYILAPARS